LKHFLRQRTLISLGAIKHEHRSFGIENSGYEWKRIKCTDTNKVKKRCRKLPAGGLGVSPIFYKVPQDWGI
jgi:hypothetical protein